MSWLGIDIGTSGCKAVVFDEEGHAIAAAAREYGTHMPRPGWAELDSDQVLRACVEVIRDAAGVGARTSPVRAIGISSQGEAFTALDAHGATLTHAMVSFDTRAAELAQTWPDRFGRGRLYRITGHTAHPMFTLFKILWLKEKRPDVWQATRSLYCFEELLQRRLGLEPAISYPLAGRTMLFSIHEHRWDPTILAAVDCPVERLARPVPSGTPVGTVPDAVARGLHLAPGTVVVAGGHDQPCGALGAGVTRPGIAMYGMGTVECICPAFPDPVLNDELLRSNLCTYDFTAAGLYTTVAFSLTGGNLLRWFRDQWGLPEVQQAREQNRDAYEILIEAMPDRPADLMVLPYFTPSGTPYFDANVRGAILGLHLGTTRGEVLRALLEGVSLEMKLNVEILAEAGLEIAGFVATGGGARNERLVQLKADVLNRPITTVEVTEAGCLGVAMLGCAAVTGEPVSQIARRWVRERPTVQPRTAFADTYAERFPRYRTLYPALKPLLGPHPEKIRPHQERIRSTAS
ncbi:MAG: hypothetical protein JXR77_15565 [Lentisphaeria bacterium]|nr:hypothetical protein [Lentisphaeria bacterium]